MKLESVVTTKLQSVAPSLLALAHLELGQDTGTLGNLFGLQFLVRLGVHALTAARLVSCRVFRQESTHHSQSSSHFHN
ncbi:hypothetical protein BDR03DRAFT_953358 [Suillus americanus]|nr:hypothetical protein BDR03DRAFT_953358 [Suillus americanus]